MSFSVISVIVMIYFIIGAMVATWLWKKYYSKKYEEAKASEEGVEEGMARMLLLFLMILWPFAIVYKLLNK
jgi:C4-dicarboxylate transporter